MFLNNHETILTGTSSGLGKYFRSCLPSSTSLLHASFESDIFKLRNTANNPVIIHSAFDARHEVVDYEQYIRSNILYTLELARLKPSYYVYISSAAVHLKDDTPYKLCKLISERIVQNVAGKHLIIRPTAVLGPCIRKNSLVKILSGDNPSLTLHDSSTFGYVLQSDIFNFVSHCIENSITGTFDFVPSSVVTLKNICKKYKKPARFGNFVHTQDVLSNKEIVDILPVLDKTSEQVIEEFLVESKNG
jgi:hypothetical protein